MKTPFAFALATLGAASYADTVYDSRDPSSTAFSYTANANYSRMADTFTTANAGVGNVWSISSFTPTAEFILTQAQKDAIAAGTLSGVTFYRQYTITLYDLVNATASGADPVMSNPIWSTTYTGTTTKTATSSGTFTGSVSASKPLTLRSDTTYGILISLKTNQTGTADPYTNNATCVLGYKAGGVLAAGSSANGFWTDTGDGVVTSSEASTSTGNMLFSMSGTAVQAVPEPSTVAAFGLGACALLRRRRRA